MPPVVEIEEVVADVMAYVVAGKLEDTENPSEDGITAAHLLLSIAGLPEDSAEYLAVLATVYSLGMMGYLNVLLNVED